MHLGGLNAIFKKTNNVCKMCKAKKMKKSACTQTETGRKNFGSKLHFDIDIRRKSRDHFMRNSPLRNGMIDSFRSLELKDFKFKLEIYLHQISDIKTIAKIFLIVYKLDIFKNNSMIRNTLFIVNLKRAVCILFMSSIKLLILDSVTNDLKLQIIDLKSQIEKYKEKTAILDSTIDQCNKVYLCYAILLNLHDLLLYKSIKYITSKNV